MEGLQRLVLVLSLLVQASSGARILGVFGHIGKSHFDAFQPLLEELASRGHDVVVLSHFPRTSRLANYTDISLVGSIKGVTATAAVDIPRIVGVFQWQLTVLLSWFGARTCEESLGHPAVTELLRSDQHFDLVLTEVFNADCYLGFARRFRAPHVALSSHVLMPWVNDRVGNPDHPGYIRQLYSGASADMSFWERLSNTAMLLYHKATYLLVEFWRGRDIVSRLFGPGTSIDELRRNTSLVLVNTHFSISGARPLVPGVIDVGGMHIKQPQDLPQELEEFVSGAEHGLIYFSMGSMIKPETLPEDKLRAFLQVFSELPQRVLWKWDGELQGRPANVLTAKWLPQLAVLKHPKMRVYISHCGNLGTLEAVHVGVPMIGIPLYGDQPNNARSLEARGVAVVLPYQDITKDALLQALKTVLEDSSYRERARRLSDAFNDRPQAPLETAVYWTEYVLRHHGAPLLRTLGADLPWYQYLLLDVVAFVAVTAFAAIYLLRRVVATVFTRKHKVD